MTDFLIEGLKIIGHLGSREMKVEEIDAQWADFCKMVAKNIHHPDFVEVVNRAAFKSKSKTTIEMVGYIRAFILTGTKP